MAVSARPKYAFLKHFMVKHRLHFHIGFGLWTTIASFVAYPFPSLKCEYSAWLSYQTSCIYLSITFAYFSLESSKSSMPSAQCHGSLYQDHMASRHFSSLFRYGHWGMKSNIPFSISSFFLLQYLMIPRFLKCPHQLSSHRRSEFLSTDCCSSIFPLPLLFWTSCPLHMRHESNAVVTPLFTGLSLELQHYSIPSSVSISTSTMSLQYITELHLSGLSLAIPLAKVHNAYVYWTRHYKHL